MTISWFNIGFGAFVVKHRYIKIFNCFHRSEIDGVRRWGIGFIQCENRHLIYVGDGGISILWIGEASHD